MIWLTWRQHRGEALVVAGVLAALVGILLWSGLAMRDTYHQLGVAVCIAHPDQGNCNHVIEAFRVQSGWMLGAVGWLNLVPALVGLLIGTPMIARELEHNTQRLVWTQSVTRWRWLAVKLALVMGVCLVASLLLTLALTWWRAPFDALDGNFQPLGFDFEGMVPLAYMAYALALAITAGVLLRRTLPAMVAAMAGFLALRLPIEFAARPNYQPPLTAVWDLLASTTPYGPHDWVLQTTLANRQGQPVSDVDAVFNSCLPNGPSTDKLSVIQCLHDHGFQNYALYQPADRFWPFQSIEAAIFIVVALGLLALATWWVRTRLS
jgi:hypothetical protein